jgi:hypothetical protein
MRNELDVEAARKTVTFAISRLAGPSGEQYATLAGMGAALQWVAGRRDGNALQQLIDGRPLAIPRDELTLHSALDNLAMIVVTLSRRFPKDDPGRQRALDYLDRQGLTPSVLRKE